MANILFLDSGVGGLAYLEYLLKDLIEEHSLYYLADVLNFPYGLKSKEDLEILLEKHISFLHKKHSLDLVILACNTATVSSLESLRKKFTIPFVGVVPALKPAQCLDVKTIGIMASQNTLESTYLQDLIQEYLSDKKAYRIKSTSLIEAIEHLPEIKTLELALKEIQNQVELYAIEALVLGCTHFLHIKNELQSIFPNVILLDSLEGVRKRVLFLLEEIKKKQDLREDLKQDFKEHAKKDLKNNCLEHIIYVHSAQDSSLFYQIFAQKHQFELVFLHNNTGVHHARLYFMGS